MPSGVRKGLTVTIYPTVHMLFIAYCQCPAIETRLEQESGLSLPPVTLESLRTPLQVHARDLDAARALLFLGAPHATQAA